MPEVQIVLDLADHDRLHLPKVTFRGNGCFKANLCKQLGIGLCSSMITDLFYPKTNKQNKRVMLGKRIYQETVNCRIPPGEPGSTGRKSPPNDVFGVSKYTRWPT